MSNPTSNPHDLPAAPGLAKCGAISSDPAGRLRSEMAMARALAAEYPAAAGEWLAYARGIENALRVLGHPVGAS